MGSSGLKINHSVPPGLDGSECIWGIDLANLTGSLKLEEGPSTDDTAAAAVVSKSTALRSLNYGLPGLVVVSSVLAFFMVATAFGNCLVIVALFRYRSLRTISNFLIGNLALSDFLLAVTILPLSSVNECLGHWVFGRLACNLWLTLDVLYCTASIWNLCVIAFDRFTATLYPLWYHEKRSTKQAAVYVLLIWSISGAICVPPALGWGELSQNYFFNNSTGVFECVLFQSPGYVLYSASGSFYIPFLITFFLYVRIFSLLRKRMRRMRRGWKLGAGCCPGSCCCAGDRFHSSAEPNGYPGCGLSAFGSATPPAKPQFLHPLAETRICLDVPKTDTAADASTSKVYSNCRSQEEDVSGVHPKSMTQGQSGAGDNIQTNSHNPFPASYDLLPASYDQPQASYDQLPALYHQLPVSYDQRSVSAELIPTSNGQLSFTMVLNGTASSIGSTSWMLQGQGKGCRVHDPAEADCSPVGRLTEAKRLDAESVKRKTFTDEVRRSRDSICWKTTSPVLLVPPLPDSSRHSDPERTSVSAAVPSFLLVPAKAANPAASSTGQGCSPKRSLCDSDVPTGATRHRCGEDVVNCINVCVATKEGGTNCMNVGVATKEGGTMGVAINGRRESCHSEEGVNTSGNRTGDIQVGAAKTESVGVGGIKVGSTDDMGCVQTKGLNLGGVVNEGGHAPSVRRENCNLGVPKGVARSVSADFSPVKRSWDTSGLRSGGGQALGGSTKSVGRAMGVTRIMVGGTVVGAGAGAGPGSGPGLCRRKRRRRPDLRETNATIKMAIIIAFFCGMWMGFFVVYVVRGWCPLSCHVPRELEAFFFWLGYSNSSMNPILYTLFNDDFRKAFQKLLGCYVRKNGSRNSRY